jgi:general secretion pathway protein G
MRFNEKLRGTGALLLPCLRRRSRAFTLIEVMIVVVIIGLLASVVTYSTIGYLERAKRQKARADIHTLAGAVDSYYLATGRIPENRDGLQVLVPEYIKVLPKDPWGNPYAYVQPGKAGGSASYDIISYGADGREGGTGADADITSNDIEVKELPKK